METPEKTPEWDIFERIEKLERLKPTVGDTSTLAISAFLLTFMNMALTHPVRARKLKDAVMTWLKKSGLSRETLETLEKALVTVCDAAEEP